MKPQISRASFAPYRFAEYNPMFFYNRLILGLALCVLVGASTAQADVISYGDLEGTNFIYQDIKESSVTDLAGLYGAPIINGDALVFNPTYFRAEASGIGGVDITDGALGTLIVAEANHAIDYLTFYEFGDFMLDGSGTSATQVSVAGSLFVSILEVDNLPVNEVINLMAAMDFWAGPDVNSYVADDDGMWDLTTNPGLNLWKGYLHLDIQSSLQSLGLSGDVTKVLVTFDNTLKAQSEEGSSAFIAKKNLIVIAAEVPEPSTITLMILGVVSLGLFYFKRR